LRTRRSPAPECRRTCCPSNCAQTRAMCLAIYMPMCAPQIGRSLEARMTVANVVAISGMIFDILGAVILARTFVVKRPYEVFREVNSFGCWDFPVTVGARNLLVSWLVQSREAKTGAVILTFGFGLQGFSQVLPQEEAPWAGILLILFAAVSLWLFFSLQSLFVRQSAHEAQSFYIELIHGTNSEDWKREIPLRQKELEEIEAEPRKWLQFGESGSRTQISTNDPPAP